MTFCHLLRGLPVWPWQRRSHHPLSIRLTHGPFLKPDEEEAMPPELWGTLYHLRSAPAASEANRLYHTVGEFPGSNRPILVPGKTAFDLCPVRVSNHVMRRPLPPIPVFQAGPSRWLEGPGEEDIMLGSIQRRPPTPAGEWLVGGTKKAKGKGMERAVSPDTGDGVGSDSYDENI